MLASSVEMYTVHRNRYSSCAGIIVYCESLEAREVHWHSRPRLGMELVSLILRSLAKGARKECRLLSRMFMPNGLRNTFSWYLPEPRNHFPHHQLDSRRRSELYALT